jgi:hypothetical protein
MSNFKDFPLDRVGIDCHLVGAVWEQRGASYLVKFPGVSSGVKQPTEEDQHLPAALEVVEPTLEDWQDLLRQSDTVETEVLSKDENGVLYKAVVRKAEHQVSKNVSWRVFKRDGYACRYCGDDDTPLTVDHLILWENGGPDTEANLVAACKQCNKARGNTSYEDWLNDWKYTKVSKNLTQAQRYRNRALALTLENIPLKIKTRKRK